jgi:hypothetical protein
MKLRPTGYLIPAILVTATLAVAGQSGAVGPITYTNTGGIALPDYSKWVFIGSGLFSSQAGPDTRFSNVFIEPAAYDQYVKTGVWPDHTVIFSEKRASVTTLPITANAGWGQTGDVIGAELEVKDASRSGWKYYEAAAGEKVARPHPDQSECTTCHVQHAAVDHVFVQFYPKLADAAKRNGTYKETTK